MKRTISSSSIFEIFGFFCRVPRSYICSTVPSKHPSRDQYKLFSGPCLGTDSRAGRFYFYQLIVDVGNSRFFRNPAVCDYESFLKNLLHPHRARFRILILQKRTEGTIAIDFKIASFHYSTCFITMQSVQCLTVNSMLDYDICVILISDHHYHDFLSSTSLLQAKFKPASWSFAATLHVSMFHDSCKSWEGFYEIHSCQVVSDIFKRRG